VEQLAEISETEDDAWAARNEHWLARTAQPGTGNRKRKSARKPLILTGHGIRLRVDHGALLIQDGFTHYPQQRKEFRFFPGDWRTPSRIALVDGSGGLSFDVLDWLHFQEIELIRINWSGKVISITGGNGYACDPAIVQMQSAARDDGRALQMAQFLIIAKLTNSITTLRDALPGSPALELAIQRLSRDAELLRASHPSSVDQVLGIEGGGAYAYFNAWRSVPMRWNGTKKHPIPGDWCLIGWRSSAINRKEATKQRATHPVNAMLNYAYGVLENQVRIQILAAGLDPRIGTLHGKYAGKHALVFDLMEPLRPVVDAALLRFIHSHTFAPGDFTITSDGICRLNPQLPRIVVSLILEEQAFQAPIGDALKILGNTTRPKAAKAAWAVA
jgi:CRISPR-associated protein Cas1